MGLNLDSPDIQAIHLLPIGQFPRKRIETLVAGLSRRVTLPCRQSPPLEGEIPRLAGREDQVDADLLLGRLESDTPTAGIFRVGVTRFDLAIPIFTFVFGRARRRGRAAVVSVARLEPQFYGLPPDPALTSHRTVLEILHEIGHLAGLMHCPDSGCLMRFAASLEAVDSRGESFCLSCAAKLSPSFQSVFSHRF